ncbi:hypothetical protein [Streptomyces sp. NRRL WC-3618]|uniref:hypothetical protein n=1 Tax=Streptomyces sp. NRRL WC-3618 TaxID=1519490 RepID=UPI000AAA3A7D|nr:hypothetical protein [Streptomyces sp. NRRL WC-3618]
MTRNPAAAAVSMSIPSCRTEEVPAEAPTALAVGPAATKGKVTETAFMRLPTM